MIWAMPESKRFLSGDVFPKTLKIDTYLQVEFGLPSSEIKEIESALDALLKRKSRVAEKQKSNELKFAEMEKQQTTLKQTVAAQKDESETKIARIEDEIVASKKITEKDKKEVEEVEGKKEVGGNRELENFLEGQILELEVELECPVCLEVATTSPIYKCLDDHLLCRLQEEKLY